MNGHLRRAATVTRGVVNGARSDRITFIAAGLAFYALVSLLPLLFLALAAAAALGDPGTVETIVDRAAGSLGEAAGTLVRDAITGAAAGGLTLVGLVVLLWSALKLFRGLDVAFSAVYGRPGPDSLGEQLRHGSAALGAVGLGAAAKTGFAERDAPTPEPSAVLEGVVPSEDHSDEQLRERLEALQAELERFERRVEERTVHRDEIETDLQRYVRRRVRRGRAGGWGPYVVLLYGTLMTLGAFRLLSDGWAVLAMVVVWLSTLGLYALMLVVGAATTAAGLPIRLRDRLRGR